MMDEEGTRVERRTGGSDMSGSDMMDVDWPEGTRVERRTGGYKLARVSTNEPVMAQTSGESLSLTDAADVLEPHPGVKRRASTDAGNAPKRANTAASPVGVNPVANRARNAPLRINTDVPRVRGPQFAENTKKKITQPMEERIPKRRSGRGK
jgi:hypothetical protein